MYRFKFTGYEAHCSIKKVPGIVYAENKYRAVFGINDLAEPILDSFEEINMLRCE